MPTMPIGIPVDISEATATALQQVPPAPVQFSPLAVADHSGGAV